jgi:hypothetical protein
MTTRATNFDAPIGNGFREWYGGAEPTVAVALPKLAGM